MPEHETSFGVRGEVATPNPPPVESLMLADRPEQQSRLKQMATQPNEANQ